MRAILFAAVLSLVTASLVSGSWWYALAAVGVAALAYGVAVCRWLWREMPEDPCDEP